MPEKRVRREAAAARPCRCPSYLLSAGAPRGPSEPNVPPAGLPPPRFSLNLPFSPQRFPPRSKLPPSDERDTAQPGRAFPRPQAATRRHGNPRPPRLPRLPPRRLLPRPGGPSAGPRSPPRSGPGALLPSPPPPPSFALLHSGLKRVPRWLRPPTGRATGARRPPPWSGARRTTPSPTTSPSSVSGRPCLGPGGRVPPPQSPPPQSPPPQPSVSSPQGRGIPPPPRPP